MEGTGKISLYTDTNKKKHSMEINKDTAEVQL